MICKATSWKEVDEDFVKTDELTPRYTAEALGLDKNILAPIKWPKIIDEFGGTPPYRFILLKDGKEYAVETQGYEYCRYIHRIK